MAHSLDEIDPERLIPVIKALAEAGATEDFAEWAAKPGNAKKLMDWYRLQSGDSQGIILVPNCGQEELLEFTADKLGISSGLLASKFAGWDFLRDEAGKAFEVLTWKPGCEVETEEVRSYFKRLGYQGNTPAFFAWVAENKPEGVCTSIDEEERLFHQPRYNWYAPYFRNVGQSISLQTGHVGHGVGASTMLVGFREVKL